MWSIYIPNLILVTVAKKAAFLFIYFFTDVDSHFINSGFQREANQ